MAFIVLKQKYIKGIDSPTFIPTGTTTIDSNGTYNISNYEFVKVLVESNNIKQLACSKEGNMWVLTKGGKLYGCGYNERGTQGSGGTADVLTFTKRLEDVDYVACDAYTTWAVKRDGTLWGTGWGTYGQQGDGKTTSHNVTKFTQRLTGVKKVSSSGAHTVALKTDGSVWTCGRGDDGQLGNGSTSIERVGTFGQRVTDVKDIFVDTTATWILKTDNTLWGCGYDSEYSIGTGGTFHKKLDDVRSVCVGTNNSVWAIKTNNSLWGCGLDSYGQQGQGSTYKSTSRYVDTFKQRLTNVASVYSSGVGTWAIKNDNTLWGCGRAKSGEQGNGSTSTEVIGKFTQRLTGVKKVVNHSVETAGTTFALKTDGTLWICGGNSYGCAGTSVSSTFTQKYTNIEDIFVCGYMTWVIKKDNTLWGTGYNSHGQQGSGNTTNVTKFTQRIMPK